MTKITTTYEIEFKVTGLNEQGYNSIIELLKIIKNAEIINSDNPTDSNSLPSYKEHWNPDWKGDPHDPDWKGW